MSIRCLQVASCSPSAHDNSYIYNIASGPDNTLAAITSADELLLVDRFSLGSSAVSRFSGVHHGITTLSVGHNGRMLYCGDSGGRVSCFDVRSGAPSESFNIGRGVTALQCRGHGLAVGTELLHHQAVASLWDLRTRSMRWQNSENNDDVTAVGFHPTRNNLLLAGGDDGLVSLFDTNVSEEDDSLVQAINHGPIHKAGFLHQEMLYALSSDQNLAIHPVYAGDRDEEPTPILLGDLRPVIPCEYVIDIVQTGLDFAVATGSHSQSRVDIVNLQGGVQLDLAKKVTLEGAHGDDIVRSLLVDDQNNVIFSAGEDGKIKAFKSA